MARTNDTMVKAIIRVPANRQGVPTDLTPFIDAANHMVDAVCLVVPTGGTTYTEAMLTRIETWLAAHFYAVDDPRSQRDRISSLTKEIETKVDLGLDVTRYGQMAMRLDVNGGLAALNNAMKEQTKKLPGAGTNMVGGVKWLGTPFEE